LAAALAAGFADALAAGLAEALEAGFDTAGAVLAEALPTAELLPPADG